MPLYFGGVEIPSGGTITFNGSNIEKVVNSGVTVWEKQIKLLDGSTNSTAWDITYNPAASFNGTTPNLAYGNYYKDSNGIYIEVKYWLTDGGPIKVCWLPLTNCTNVKKLTAVYSNNVNGWDTRSTYFGIRAAHDVKYYGTNMSNSGVQDALTANGTRQFYTVGDAAHSQATQVFNLGSSMNISSYYFVFGVAVEGNQNTNWMRLHSLIAE